MLSNTLRLCIGALAVSHLAIAEPYATSATSVESVTAPVDFLWPDERPWYATYQNESPCGTNTSVGSRTDFPLESGLVSLTIASNAYSVALRVAYMDDPISQSNFTSEIIHTAEVEAGHQCYSVPDAPSSVTAGTNATIQLEYTAQYNGSAYEIFYACADITFVEEADFTTDVSCFNVTVTGASSNAIVSSSSSSSSTATSAKSSSNLTGADKAGIAIGVIVGSLAMVGALAFWMLRKRAAMKQKDAEAAARADMKEVDDGDSFTSAETTTQ